MLTHGGIFMCTVSLCENPIYAFGLCQLHYKRNAKYGDPLAGTKNRASPAQRFWRFVEKSDGCWDWIGSTASGYGRFSVGKKSEGSYLAHRFSWELHNNAKIPDGLFVMHKCDNKKCTNPEHLTLGTPKENTQDMIAKGRKRTVALIGAGNGKSILNEEKVRFIRSSDLSHAALARLLDVSTGCVRGVRIGRTWSHVSNINEIT
jgi:hypothetical protein